mmetsp:Transcript_6382/g.10909  ORF Transcript_6382/g.10909 Transcript_6382/m.10909 type:complete len:210 (-) Transcript_6382:790-1419(-)|eukprot:CAMPEP_0119105018 /NCGR_PEP_ID=MMETSP1180-20130426/3083_1 /TAXON_ID=3052 ORGANISM="Chlamydomonas cf sp, Strain CCMP681" /NCGR_SAMPLE_ID=MMETSP1180 /ASSEMBLY_ACC=CAM_ASM_000741 /LENGTH=209 /DNA_ID=CAMNT_0007089939 /DNA_START=67 /DNA_END=696 /DNA_ORIENTATION=-
MASPHSHSHSPGRKQREVDHTVFGYTGVPDVPALHRDVYKWIQGLDLSHALKSVRRDISNGFLVAEIFSRHFPNDIQMHGFANATSSHYKRDNWNQLQRFCIKQGIDLPSDLVEGTAAGLHGAGIGLLEHLYTLFTGKKVPRAVLPAGAQESSMPLGGSGLAPTGTGDGGAKTISTTLKAGAPISFGLVQTAVVSEDPLSLRRKLAAQG